MIQGKDLLLSLNGAPLAASTTCKLSTETDFIEVCPPTGGEWKDYIPTQHGWDVSAGCLIASMENHSLLLRMQKSKQRLELSFYDQGLQVFYKGDAYIKKLDTIGNYGNLAKMSVAFQACGELKIAAAQVIDMTTGDSTGRMLGWGMGEGRIYIIDRDSGDPFANTYELTLTKDTRFTLLGRGAIINADADTVTNWIMGKDGESINAAAIIVHPTWGQKTDIIRVPSGEVKVTVIMNSSEVNPKVIYLSKI